MRLLLLYINKIIMKNLTTINFPFLTTKRVTLALVLAFVTSCETDDFAYQKQSSDSVNKIEQLRGELKVNKTYYLESGNEDQSNEFQALIDQMNSGDQLILKSGNHYLSRAVHVRASGLRIVGEEHSAIRRLISNKGASVVLEESANKTVIDRLYIDGGNGGDACMIVFSNENSIVNSTFRNAGVSGLLIHESHFNLVEGCKVFYNNMVGISQWKSSDNEIKYCQVYENGAEGITIDGHSHNSHIHHNWIHKNNLPIRGVGGIGIDASNGAQIHDNTIDFNGIAGITFQNNICGGCDGVTIYENQNISFNKGPGIKLRYNNQPISNLGYYSNNMNGNIGGEIKVDTSKEDCKPIEDF